jgi:hypothetical protein
VIAAQEGNEVPVGFGQRCGSEQGLRPVPGDDRPDAGRPDGFGDRGSCRDAGQHLATGCPGDGCDLRQPVEGGRCSRPDRHRGHDVDPGPQRRPRGAERGPLDQVVDMPAKADSHGGRAELLLNQAASAIGAPLR